jgi:hypothetical protein
MPTVDILEIWYSVLMIALLSGPKEKSIPNPA